MPKKAHHKKKRVHRSKGKDASSKKIMNKNKNIINISGGGGSGGGSIPVPIPYPVYQQSQQPQQYPPAFNPPDRPAVFETLTAPKFLGGEPVKILIAHPIDVPVKIPIKQPEKVPTPVKQPVEIKLPSTTIETFYDNELFTPQGKNMSENDIGVSTKKKAQETRAMNQSNLLKVFTKNIRSTPFSDTEDNMPPLVKESDMSSASKSKPKSSSQKLTFLNNNNDTPQIPSENFPKTILLEQPKKTRKPRSDKGIKRAPYGTNKKAESVIQILNPFSNNEIPPHPRLIYKSDNEP
jgi:hypothetical protein